MKSVATRIVPAIPAVLLFLAAMLFLGACSTPGQTAHNNGAAGTQGTEGSGNAMRPQDGTNMSGKESDAESSDGNSTVHPAELMVNTPAEEINAWGDSITEGYGSDGATYPEVLEQLTGIPVRNLGIGGEDSREILSRSIAYGRQEEDRQRWLEEYR